MENTAYTTRIESDIKSYFGSYFQVKNVRDLDEYVAFQDQNGNNYWAKKSRNSIKINSIRKD